jgi:hypothetical protein
MILSIILLSIAVSIFILIQYVYTKNYKYRRRFIGSFFITFSIMCIIGLILLIRPHINKAVDFYLLFWIITGYIMLVTLGIQILIFSRVYSRYQDPENYHYNYFGRKVMHTHSLSNGELKAFLLTMPVFLFSGSYFVAKLISMFLYDDV